MRNTWQWKWYDTSKPTLSDTPLLVRSHLLIPQKQSHQLWTKHSLYQAVGSFSFNPLHSHSNTLQCVWQKMFQNQLLFLLSCEWDENLHAWDNVSCKPMLYITSTQLFSGILKCLKNGPEQNENRNCKVIKSSEIYVLHHIPEMIILR